MILKIGQTKIDFFNRFNLVLKYDSVASAFSFDYYFNPNNPAHKVLFKPGQYKQCSIEHENQLILTGTILSSTFNDSAEPELCSIAGYSLPGVLEDCEIPPTLYPLQSDGLSLREIAQKLIKPFGLKMLIDAEVTEKMNGVFKTSTADEKQSIKSYLTELAAQKNINITHTPAGELLFTKAKTKQTPILNFDFTNPMPGLKISLTHNGQVMHSEITVIKQASADGGNAGQTTIKNPYVNTYRPKVKIQTSGNDITTTDAARNALADELKGFKITIDTDRWVVDGKLLTPNNIITITAPRLFLNKKIPVFIESVTLTGDETKTVASLTCVFPEVYNNNAPINVFTP